jgi:hypothetical protein
VTVTETAAGTPIAAELLADRLNAVLNRTVSDSRLSVIGSEPDRNAFELTNLVDGNTAPLELDATTLRLFVRQVVVVNGGHCKTESYSYRLQTDPSPKSWLIRWDYLRDPPAPDYAHPNAHVHINGLFPDGSPIGHLHIPTGRMPLELVVRDLITNRNVPPRSEDWEAILEESLESFDGPRTDHSRQS